MPAGIVILIADGWARLVSTSLVFAGFLVALVLAWRAARRLLVDPDPPNRSAWDLDTLRTLHEQGELSQEEYERLRAEVISDLQRADR